MRIFSIISNKKWSPALKEGDHKLNRNFQKSKFRLEDYYFLGFAKPEYLIAFSAAMRPEPTAKPAVPPPRSKS